MYKRVTVAHNESPEASRALTSAIRLARMLGAELRAVTILESPPAYTAFAGAADPSPGARHGARLVVSPGGAGADCVRADGPREGCGR